jgi:hypothetical protein
MDRTTSSAYPHRPLRSAFWRAHGAGCSRDDINLGFTRRGRLFYVDDRLGSGVIVRCSDGVIAMFAMPGSRVREGCERPTTREHCAELLDRVGKAPPDNLPLGFLGGR